MTVELSNPSAATLTVFHSTDSIAEAPWNAVIGATPSAQYGSLRTFESASTLGAKPHYFVLGSRDRPLAVAIGYLARTARQCERITRPLLGRAQFLAAALVKFLGPTLILGLRPTHGPALLTDTHLAPDSQKSNLHQLCSQIEGFADEHGLTLAVVGLTDHDQALIGVLRESDFNETLSYPTAELKVCWDSWDGYLQHLKPTRRKFVRREIKTFATAGCRIRRLEAGEPVPSEFYDLLQQHQLRKNNRAAQYSSTLLDELRSNLPRNALIYLAEDHDRLLGFMGVLWKDTVAALPYLGIGSNARASEMFVYFNLIFYQLARDAPGIGLERILYGSAVYQAKRLRGCSIVPTRLFVRPRKRVTRAVSGAAIELHRRWYERKFSHLYARSTS